MHYRWKHCEEGAVPLYIGYGRDISVLNIGTLLRTAGALGKLGRDILHHSGKFGLKRRLAQDIENLLGNRAACACRLRDIEAGLCNDDLQHPFGEHTGVALELGNRDPFFLEDTQPSPSVCAPGYLCAENTDILHGHTRQ